MTKHAKLSPSSAAQWLKCTASIALEAGFEERESRYAAEGTYAHALCELEAKYATGQITKRQLTARKKKIYNAEFHDAEVEEAAAFYANYIKAERAGRRRSGGHVRASSRSVPLGAGVLRYSRLYRDLGKRDPRDRF